MSNFSNVVAVKSTVSPPLVPAKLIGSTLTTTESVRPLLCTVTLVRPGATADMV